MTTHDGKQVLPIYIQHAAPILAKTMARKFSLHQLSIQATYRDSLYKIINFAALIRLGIEVPAEDLTMRDFVALIERVKAKSRISLTLLCADANLGNPGDEKLSASFHDLVLALKPTALLPFSDTLVCVDEANAYLSRQANHYRHCAATSKSGVEVVIKGLLDNPGIWSTSKRNYWLFCNKVEPKVETRNANTSGWDYFRFFGWSRGTKKIAGELLTQDERKRRTEFFSLE